MLSDKELWDIVNVLLHTSTGKLDLVRHHMQSYENFLCTHIPAIINDFNNFSVHKKNSDTEKTIWNFSFQDVVFGVASYVDKNANINYVYPMEARTKNLTYSLPAYVDIICNVKKKENDQVVSTESQIFKKQLFGHIPLMVGSKFCMSNNIVYDHHETENTLDPGGYFIIKGNEKVVICQERIRDNKCFFYTHKDQKNTYVLEIRSNKTMTEMANALKIIFSPDGTLKTSFVNVRGNIPLMLLFRYYGAENDEQIMKYICGNSPKNKTERLTQMLVPSFEELHKALKEIEENDWGVEQYIESKFTNPRIKLKYLGTSRILPHIIGGPKAKCFFLGYMTQLLFKNIQNNTKTIDRDSLTNKKIETTGTLLAQLFRKLWKDILASLKNTIFKEKDWVPSSNKILKRSIVTNKLNSSLATGSWDSKISSDNKKSGVAQMLKRLTYIATISHLRRLNSPVNKTGRLVDPRKLHNSQFGFCCVAESPEGQMIGLIKNLSLAAVISAHGDEEVILHLLDDMDSTVPLSTEIALLEDDLIFVNGKLRFSTCAPWIVLNALRKLRRTGKINAQTSLCYKPKTNELHISTDEGRLLRPLLIVYEKNKLKVTKEIKDRLANGTITQIDLLNEGIIEYIDAQETEMCLIAMSVNKLEKTNIKYSHCEIHNSLIFGVSASLIPFPEHNQAPRVLYQCAQAKQAIGLNNFDVLRRLDTVNHILNYPQTPLIYTKPGQILGTDRLPSGCNLVVAVACFGAYNIEDSVVINRGALERGLFHITSFKTYRCELKKELSHLSEEILCNPKKNKYCSNFKMGNYSKLMKNGLVNVGTKVEENDIIIGKMAPMIHDKKNKKYSYNDTSIQIKQSGIIDRTVLTENHNDETICKVKLRRLRIPEVGDKVSSRHGQKSTIGLVVDESDMPFTESGIIPDIIINPHCLPSRMTIGQILECVLGKYGAMNGHKIDGSAFQKKYDTDNLDKLLMSAGFHGSGREILYNGETGKQMQTKIFIGPTYYQRLKHMVSDKMHARASGPINRLTHQPVEGRSRGGGLRLGNMELDCLHSHGTAHFLKEKFFDCSDTFFVYICTKCCVIASVNKEKNVFRCHNMKCKANDFKRIALPYSSKLLLYELMGMGIMTKFHV